MRSPSSAPSTVVLDGMWWKQEPNVAGFIALGNTTSHSVTAKIDVSDNLGNSFKQHAVEISPNGMKMVNLDELATATTSEGGIRVTYTGQNRDLLVNGGLEDQSLGYSVALPTSPAPMDPTVSRATVAELGLMTGPADPMMQFPAGIIFTPYTVVRNTSDKPLAATPTLWWMAGGAAQSFQLPAIKLSPYQSQTLKVPALLSAAGLKNFAGTVHLVFDVPENADGFFLSGGSVDQTDNYVFSITPHGISESAAKSLSYWSTANGDDTMVTLWNPADEAQDFVFQLTFTGGHYQLPIHLEPRATRIFNISEIGRIPDDEGNIIPAGIHEGGAQIMGVHGDSENILIAMDAGTYNVRKATCGQFCHGCLGEQSYAVAANPFAVGVGSQVQLNFSSYWTNGSQYNESSGSTWSTNHSGIAAVGTAGLVTGTSTGSATISAVTNGSPDPIGVISDCEPFKWTCPVGYTGGSGSSPGNVAPVINSVSPDVVVVGGTVASLTINGSGFGSSPTVNLPQGVSFTGGQGSTDSQIILHNVFVSVNAPIGPNSLTVTAKAADGTSQTSNPGPFTLDGPFYMTVVSEQLQKCSGCTTTVQRTVLYQVQYFSGVNAGTTPIGENPVTSNWNCSQSPAGISSSPCSKGGTTNSAGQFQDRWSLNSDSYTPAGCGENVDDHWMWCTTGNSIGHLSGYCHTNAVSINGVVNPPNQFTAGMVINP